MKRLLLLACLLLVGCNAGKPTPYRDRQEALRALRTELRRRNVRLVVYVRPWQVKSSDFEKGE